MDDGLDAPELFGDYLGTLLDARTYGRPKEERWSASRLARELHVDVTLVHHWRANRRIPHAHFVAQIAEMLDLTQEEHAQLQAALQMTLEEKRRGTLRPGARKRLLSGVLRKASTEDTSHRPHLPSVPHYVSTEPLPHMVKTFEGTETAVRAAIRLLSAATEPDAMQRALKGERPTIYITYFGARDAVQAAGPEHNEWFKGAIRQALDRGWDVRVMIYLDGNIRRSIGIVEDTHTYLGTHGLYLPYCARQRGSMRVPYGMCIVPGVGALLHIATTTNGHVDAATYFPASSYATEVRMLTKHCEQQFDPSVSESLFEVFETDVAGMREFDLHIAAAEAVGGDRILVKDGLSALARPLSFYEEGSTWLQRLPPTSRAHEAQLYTERLLNFQKNVWEYSYHDICSKRAVERLMRGVPPHDDDATLERKEIAPQDRRTYVENVIHLLENYPNYALALLDEDEEHDILSSYWQVVGCHTVLVESWRPGRENETPEVRVQFMITEDSIVRAYHEYGQELWRRVRPHNRDREYVKVWLKQCLATLS